MSSIFKNGKLRRITGFLTAVILVLTLAPAEAMVALAETLTGGLTITGDSGWNYENNVLTITGGGSYTISGTTTTDRVVISADEAVEVTAEGLSITSSNGSPFEITGTGDVNLILSGENFFTSESYEYAGLQKNEVSNMLTISSLSGDDKADTLTAVSGSGYINIAGAAGIGGGSGSGGNGSNIAITGGTIKATGGYGGAGIGGGYNGSGENITISGGVVEAYGNTGAAGIGGGSGGSGENITVTGGTVTATGDYAGAGIGGGTGGSGENITISGGTVEANGGDYGAGIGGGYYGSGKNITISGGTVEANGGDYGSGIGGGNGMGSSYGNGENITISGGIVTATGGSNGAGIGGGYGGSGENIAISGGTVEANGSYYAAGIGGSYNGSGKNITISGGTVEANGGDYGAGIGGGLSGSGENIIISGGYITLSTDSTYTAYIGSGLGGDTDTVTITGGYFAQGTVTTNDSVGSVYDVTVADGCQVIENPIESTKSAYPYVVNNGLPLQITGYSDSSDYSYVAEGTDSDGNERRVLTISSGGTYRVSMSAGYTATSTDRIVINSEDDVILTITDINVTSSTNSPFRADKGNLTLILEGDNVLKSTVKNYPGLTKESTDYTLTITSIDGDGKTEGSLEATGASLAAGIGGGSGQGGNNIIISGGTITATGSYDGAGIGGGSSGSGSNITISGGTITATGGAGIGGGSSGSGSNITISGGIVKADSYYCGAGIGGGSYSGSGTNITITGGTVTATGGSYSNFGGAGIGGGAWGDGDSITISGGTVTVNGGTNAATVGGGSYSSNYSGNGSNIVISGGYITLAKVSSGAAYIGGGANGTTGTVSITGGYFGMGVLTTADTAGTVYETAVGSNCQVLANEDTATKGTYPYYVSLPRAFVITAADGGTITEDTDYTYTGGVLTVINGGSYKIAMNKDENITATDTDRIVINSEDDVTLTITNINVKSSTNSPFRADKGNLTLILEGKNVLTSATENYPGLTKELTDYTLKITSIDGDGKTEGSLEATGGDWGAGIGGGYGSKGANIEIAGGTITATGGGNSKGGGAGIGGGNRAGGENITISGGTVTATGGSYGAGIGGGALRDGDNIEITGGIVTANGGLNAAAVGGGSYYSIFGGNGSNIVISGGYITLTKVSSDAAYIGGGTDGSGNSGTATDISITGGYFGEGVLTTADTAGSVYGAAVGSNCSVLANEDAETKDTYPYYVYQIKDFVISAADGGTLTENKDYTYTGGVLTVINGGSYKIAMNKAENITSTDTDRIVIDTTNSTTSEDVTLTITDINVISSTNSPFRADKGNLTLILEGDNVLTATADDYAGLTKVTTDYILTITSTEDADGKVGSLEATGGRKGAGIGGGSGKDGNNITIESGTVTATGGYNGAGIGGGDSGSGSGITISDGEVTATGSYWAAGIGGGSGGSGSNIEISGGTVTAAGGHNGAGIGGGDSGSGSNITISGGTVTATGGHANYETYGGAGIGGGSWGDGDSITISGGTVTANGGTNSAAVGGGSYISSRNSGNGSNIVISGGYITLTKVSSSAAYIGGGVNSSGNSGSATDISISGGYFGQGDLTAQVVYEAAVASGSVVVANDDATYPFYVYSPNAFVITANDENSYTYTDRVLTILQGGTYTIAMNTDEGITSTSTDRIVVNSTGDVTLTIEKINVTSSTNSPFRAESGNLTLYLSGDNYLTSTAGNYAGLSKAEGDYSLEITDSSSGGSLTAVGGADGAGIGGDKYVSVGNITINGATVTAKGSENGAGIGGGYDGTGSSITITGGSVVTATGGTYGAGIGGGKFKNGTNISIDGAETVVYAYGDYAAGIGGGQASDKDSIGDNITIADGTVTATSSRGAGIGGGYSNGTSSTGSNITISGGTVTASSTHESKSGAAIGSGGSYSEANGIASGITITGGYLTLSSASGDIIGVGANGGTVGNISITGGYFGTGDTENDTVYGTAVDSNYEVYSNSDADTAANYPVYVAGAVKPFVISAVEGDLDPASYTYRGKVLTITAGGSYKIAMNTAEGITSTSTDRIVINSADEVTVTVEAVQITGTNGGSPFNITGSGSVNLIISGKNIFTSTAGDYAGLQKTTETNTLTISSAGSTDDSLEATGSSLAAGIGGSWYGSGSNITIKGGTVKANGGSLAAGIGGGREGSGSNITIEGGTVEANGGGDGGAGIGGGSYCDSSSNITIKGGKVTANGGKDGAGIGGGKYGSSNITIEGGTVEANGGEYGAGIGSGYWSGSGNITITGGTVEANGGKYGAGIGGGGSSSGSNITIKDGTVTATGGIYAAGIGGGQYSNGSNITIEGGKVTAIGSGEGYMSGAGIGGGYAGSGSDITISGGYILLSRGLESAAYIGKGSGSNNSSTNITITGGYFGLGDLTAQTVYETAVADTYFVYSNDDTATKTEYPYLVAGELKAFVITSADDNVAIAENTDYTYTGNVLTILTGGSYKIAMNTVLGTSTDTDRIVINSADEVTVTVEAVQITGTSGGSPFNITGSGSVNLIISGENIFTSTAGNYAGLQKTTTSNTLTISSAGGADDSLEAAGGNKAAGIGGGDGSSGRNITINSGTVTATGGSGGAGIGGGSGGTISKISSGSITFTGYEGGSGSYITVNGGTVTATGGSGGAGIGGGSGGTYISELGGTSSNLQAYEGGSGSYITVNGGTVTAAGGSNGAGIGSGYGGSYSDITLIDGTVSATGGSNGASIGGGRVIATSTATLGQSSGSITVTGGYITLSKESDNAAYIGGGSGGTTDASKISITGGYFGSGDLGKQTVYETMPTADYQVYTNSDTYSSGTYPVYVAAATDPAYTIWAEVTDTDTSYNPGDVINADIYVSAAGGASLDAFTVSLDSSLYTVTAATVSDSITAVITDNTVSASGMTSEVAESGTKAVSVQLTVNTGITTAEDVEIDVNTAETVLTPVNRSTSFTPAAGTSDTVNLYNITMAFKAGNAVFNSDSTAAELTAYLRYGETGLYTSDSYDTAFEVPTVTVENTAYRLEDDSWILYIDGTAQTGTLTADDLEAYTISDGKAYYVTPSLIDIISVTITQAEATQGTIYYDGTAIEANTVKYFDSGTTIKDVTDLITFTPAQGAYYSLAGWYADDVLVTDYTTVLTGGEVLKPYITTDTYGWSENVTGEENIAFENLAGAYNNVVTYGTDITFSLNPKEGYKVYSVYYTIGAGTETELTAVNGVYTISGSDISGDVTLNVTVKQYHTITFEAGTGTEMTGITAYAWSGMAGLYSSLEGLGDSTYSLTENDIAGGVSALPDYDLATDTAGDGLWSSGGVVYTTDAVLATAFSADTAFTANATAKNTAAYKAWIKVIDTDTNYNVGDTVNADIYISADSEANADKVKIALNEDWFTISEVSVGENASYTNSGNVITAENLNTTVTTGGTAVISLKLTVNSDITTNEAAEITIDEDLSYITPYGRTVQVKPEAGTAAQVGIYNITLTFKPGNAVFNNDSSITALTAYIRYNEAGLYTANSYAQAFTIPTVTVDGTAYRLNEDSWILYIDGTAQDGILTAADLAAYTISNDKTYEVMPSVTEQISVTIAPAETSQGTIYYDGTAVEANTVKYFDSGTTIKTVTDLITFTPAQGAYYSLAGWYADDVLVTDYTTVLTGGEVLKPYITTDTYGWSENVTGEENIAFGNLAGAYNNVVTYGTDITFSLNPKDGYKVYSVYYTIGTGTAAELTAANGVYTISGSDISGDVTLNVTVKQYHTITFEAGTGTEMTSITAYAWSGTAGLYSSLEGLGDSTYSLTEKSITDAVSALPDYDLATDIAGDGLWSSGGVVYTTDAVLATAFSADTAFTANATAKNTAAYKAWIKVIDTDTNYNVGDTINADIYISADSEANADRVKIALNEDWFTISEVSVGENASYTNAGNVITAEGLNTTISTSGTAVISLKLTVNSDITTNEAAQITIDEDLSYITPYGRTVQVKPEAGAAAQVGIYNITLTFKPGNAVFNGDSSITALTAYIRYNEAGLYSSNGYTTAFEIPTVTVENTAYRLNEDSWILYIDGTAQENTLTAADLAAYTISNDKVYEVMPSVTEQISVTITPADSAYGVISYNETAVEASITNTFDSGITLEDISNLITFETAGDTSYSLSGWYIDGNETPVLAANYAVTAITANTTLSPYITANKFDWSSSVTNGSIENLTGVENGVITYGNDITFTLTPADGYKIYSVYYTVEGNVPVQLTETNGVYTIPGKAVVNNVSLDVTINKYYTITFGAGIGSEMADITAYAWSGIAGLYSSADNLGESAYSMTASDITNGLTSENGYRLADDTVGDELWTEGSAVYTTAAVLEKTFTSDTAFTANAVRQYTVTFEAGENGSISGTTEITVDSGKSITDMGGTLPTAEANNNYVFKGWFINDAEVTEIDILAMEVTEDITLTAEFTESTYSVTFAETPAGTFSDITGVTEENGSYTAVYNTDVTFTFTANDDYEISEIYFTADGTKHSLNDKAGGSYTIPGSEITGTISVIVESSATRTFTFTVNPESGGSLIGTTAFTLLLGKYLTEEQINSISVIAPTGYSFKGWRITAESNVYNSSLDSSTSTDLVDELAEEVIIADDNLSGSAVEIEEYEPVEEQNAPVETTPSVNVSLASLVSDRIYTTDELLTIEADRNITFEAVFELTDFSVTDENSTVTITDGVDESGNAHYGTDITFTLTGGKIISYIGYKIGENGSEVKLTADENGVFTIPGSAVTDNVYIITTVISNIEITFITHDDYLGEAVTAGEGRKIAILNADLLDSGTYALTNGRVFYYSEKYGAYVIWVDEDTTAEALSAEITINLNGTTTSVDYSGDLNGSGSTTSADAGMLSDILANAWTKDLTDSQLFSLDVEQAEAPKQIYTSDAVWILLNNTGTDD